MRLHAATKDLYMLHGKEEADEFDKERRPDEKYFTGVIEGGNAFLVDDADIDVAEEAWLGTENKESGYRLDFDETDSTQLRAVVLQGLVHRGYGVCPWEHYLLFVPYLAREREMVEQDLQELIEGQAGSPVLVTSRQRLAAAREALDALLTKLRIPLDLGEEEADLWEKLFGALRLERSCLYCGEDFLLRTPHDVQCPGCEARSQL